MTKSRNFLISLAVMLMGALSIQAVQAQGEVTRSGSTWSARVNGSTVYTGNRMFDAVNAACNNAGNGATINIRNSGDSGNDGGSVYAIRPLAGQTLDFHGHAVNCNSNGDLIVAVHADRRNNITVRNLHVTGNPRYAIWFRGCSNVTLNNITMNLSNNSPVGLGIRVDASTGSASNLTINGNININGSAGHAIETYSVNGVSIGDVTVTNTGGCGVLLNDSENCTVGVVTGDRNNQGGGYATFRVANNNRSTYCAGVYSRNSGRGFFSVSGSRDCTVEWVDIANTTSHGIFLEDATNTHVLCGTVSGGSPNCQEVRTNNCSINVNGCGGSNCGGGSSSGGSSGGSSSGSNGSVNGTYSIIASHSGKALDTYNWGTGNGTNIVQWAYWGGDAQRFNISQVDGDWHRITPVISSGQAFDIDGVSTANGANLHTWAWWGGNGQQFRFQSAGSGVWRIIARNSEKCLDVEDVSTSDGANIFQWTCISGASNQMFELISHNSGDVTGGSITSGLNIYPNPAVNGQFSIDVSEMELKNETAVAIYSFDGKKVFAEFYNNLVKVDLDLGLKSGMYVVTLKNGETVLKKKLTVQ